MKIAFDIHGVIDKVDLSNYVLELQELGHTVVILTGMAFNEKSKNYLEKFGFIEFKHYSIYFSIVDFRESQGCLIEYKDGMPYLSEDLWNSAKAEICKLYNIDILVDDSLVYAPHFNDIDTKYVLFDKNYEIYLKQALRTSNLNEPYLIDFKTIYNVKWNKDYDQDKICICGHPYYRHFDSYDNNSVAGCKYCFCNTFKPKN